MIFLKVDNEYRRWIKTSNEEKFEVLFLEEREKIIQLAENSEKLPSEASELLTGFYFSCILFRCLFLRGLKKKLLEVDRNTAALLLLSYLVPQRRIVGKHRLNDTESRSRMKLNFISVATVIILMYHSPKLILTFFLPPKLGFRLGSRQH